MNIMAFCKEYNAQTAKMIGDIIPVEITVYEVRVPRWRPRMLSNSGPTSARGSHARRLLLSLTNRALRAPFSPPAGPQLHLHPEDSPRFHPAEEGCW